jgi:hypothetical protein
MLTALEGAQAGLGDQFVAHVGTTMALASAMPPDWFPKTGTPTAAQIATFVMRLHGLTTIVWANYPTAGVTNMLDWIVPHGSALTEAIRTELLQTGAAPGSGQAHADIQTKKMLSYPETTSVVSAHLYQQWTDYVAAGSLAGAEALISSGSDWGKMMTRAVTFADMSCTRAVTEREPCRVQLNFWLQAYKKLQGARTFTAVSTLAPQASVVEPAVRQAVKIMLEFPDKGLDDYLKIIKKAAALLMQQEAADVDEWDVSQAQEATKLVLTVMESSIFGPAMGGSCPDRASSLIGQWAIQDSQFRGWTRHMNLGGGESPAFNYAQEVVLTPVVKWAVKLWAFWSEPGSPNPGTLATALAEPVLMLEVSHTLMRQELHRLTKARLSSRKKKRSRAADSSDESNDESSNDESETPPKQTGKAAKKAQLADDAKGGGKGGGGLKRGRGKGKQFQGKKGRKGKKGKKGN